MEKAKTKKTFIMQRFLSKGMRTFQQQAKKIKIKNKNGLNI